MKAALVIFQDSAVGDSVKDIAEVQADNIHNIHSLSLIIITVLLGHKMLCLQETYFRNSDISKGIQS